MAKLAKHPILGSHTLMAPYTTKKETVAASGPQEDAATIQIIEARLTNTKTVKEHMSKLWDELEHIITGKKANEEKNKKRKGSDDQDEPKVIMDHGLDVLDSADQIRVYVKCIL